MVIVGVFPNSLILRVVQLCLVILMYSSRQVWVILLVGIHTMCQARNTILATCTPFRKLNQHINNAFDTSIHVM